MRGNDASAHDADGNDSMSTTRFRTDSTMRTTTTTIELQDIAAAVLDEDDDDDADEDKNTSHMR